MATTKAGFSVGDSSVIDELLGSDAGNLLARKYTLANGQSVVRGTVMGVVTSGGQVVKSLSASSDGSQTPFGIAAEDADSALGDNSPSTVDINIYTRGNFNENRITLGTAHTIASIREGLRDKGIYLETPVKRYPA